MYGVELAQMNRQVKRNIQRFPEDFMFQLIREEYNSLKCQNGILNIGEFAETDNESLRSEMWYKTKMPQSELWDI